MGFLYFANHLNGTLSTGIGISDTVLTVDVTSGVTITIPANGKVPLALLSSSNPSAVEVVYCTAVSGTQFTVQRGMENTTPQTWAAGSIILGPPTAGSQQLFTQAGYTPVWSSAIATQIGGYQIGALVPSATTANKIWQCTTNNNTSNPDAGGAGWAAYGPYLPLTGGTLTGELVINSTLDVTGISSLGSLGVVSNAEITGNLEVGGTINTSSQILLNEGLYTSGSLLVGTSNGNTNPFVNASSGLAIFPSGQINTYGAAWALGGAVGTLMSIGTEGLFVGSISTSTTAVSFNTGSDERLKTNVKAMTGALERVNSVPARRFVFVKEGKTEVDGFLAHEAQAAIPEAVMGTRGATKVHVNAVLTATDSVLADGVSQADWESGKINIPRVKYVPATKTTKEVLSHPGRSAIYPPDSKWVPSYTAPVHQQIDHSKLVPVLWGAVQELSAQVAELTKQLASLASIKNGT
jgi:hypothetical protein